MYMVHIMKNITGLYRALFLVSVVFSLIIAAVYYKWSSVDSSLKIGEKFIQSMRRNAKFLKPHNETYDQLIAQRFAARYKQMHDRCTTKRPRTDLFAPNSAILLNLNHGLEVCVTGKVGSSSWHHMVWQMRRLDEGKPIDKKYYTYKDTEYNHMTSKDPKARWIFGKWTPGVDDDFFTEPNKQNVHRIILGRHPFARVISAWSEKMNLHSPSKVYEHFLNINPDMKKYRNVEPDKDHAMSWEDFAQYVSEHVTKNYRRDYHFRPISEQCLQCQYFFTYVVKLESLGEDYDWLMRRIGIPGEITLGKSNESTGGSKVNNNPGLKVQEYMKRLPPNVIQDLYNLYKEDFINFGYTFDFNTGMAGGFD